MKFGQNPISGLEKMLFKEIVDARTHGQTMDVGKWAITKAHLEHNNKRSFFKFVVSQKCIIARSVQ